MSSKKAHILPGEDPFFHQNVDFYKFLQIGVITRVDNERHVIDIQFQSNPAKQYTLPLTDPFYTGRAFIGGMPEAGSKVICGFIKLTNKIGVPVVVAYLNDDYLRSLAYIYNFGKTSSEVKELESIHEKIGYNITRLKRRKLYPGDVNLESSQGSEILLDQDILLSDMKLNELRISSTERKILQNSINNQIYTNAGRILNGMVERPYSPFIEPVILENGKQFFVVTDNGQSPNYNGKAFTELRTEIREVANNILDVVETYDFNDFKDSSSNGKILVTQMLGTLVGNIKTDLSRYGRVLRPQIFANDDNSFDVQDVICKPDEYFDLASAYQLMFASGTKFDIDKEGHTFIHLSASSAKHPLGAGRSLEFASDGGIRLLTGKSAANQRSIELDTTGLVKLHFGSDSNSLLSLDWTLDRAIKLKVLAPDPDGYALREEYFGSTEEIVHGDKTITVDGKLRIIVAGRIQEEILGAKTENYVNDKMTNYGGNYQEIVIQEKQSKYGEGHTTDIATKGDKLNILQGNKEEKLLLGNKTVLLTLGDSTETLLLGNKKTTLTLGDIKNTVLSGNISDSITLGDRKTSVITGNITESIKLGDSKESITIGNKNISIKVGDYEVTVTAGNIKIKTTAGTVDMMTATQTVTITGMLKITVKSGVKVSVQAPMVDIGGIPVSNIVGGLPGVPTHLDYLTALPLLGSATVKTSI